MSSDDLFIHAHLLGASFRQMVFSAFTPTRPAALDIIRKIWLQLRVWKTTLANLGAEESFLEAMVPAIRDLEQIASPELQKEIRK